MLSRLSRLCRSILHCGRERHPESEQALLAPQAQEAYGTLSDPEPGSAPQSRCAALKPTAALVTAWSQNFVRDFIWEWFTVQPTLAWATENSNPWITFWRSTLLEAAFSGLGITGITLLLLGIFKAKGWNFPGASAFASGLAAWLSVFTWNLGQYVGANYIFAALGAVAANYLSAIFTGTPEGFTQIMTYWLIMGKLGPAEDQTAFRAYLQHCCARSHFPTSLIFYPFNIPAGAVWQLVNYGGSLMVTNGVSDPTQMAELLAQATPAQVAALSASVAGAVMACNIAFPHLLWNTANMGCTSRVKIEVLGDDENPDRTSARAIVAYQAQAAGAASASPAANTSASSTATSSPAYGIR